MYRLEKLRKEPWCYLGMIAMQREQHMQITQDRINCPSQMGLDRRAGEKSNNWRGLRSSYIIWKGLEQKNSDLLLSERWKGDYQSILTTDTLLCYISEDFFGSWYKVTSQGSTLLGHTSKWQSQHLTQFSSFLTLYFMCNCMGPKAYYRLFHP